MPRVLEVDAAIIGAGAAGMMCAAVAGQRGRRVVLIEHYHRLGEKIRISGGGRCNFTNLGCTAENYLSQNPHFCRSALARFGPADFIALVERYGIAYHEKTRGQLFCDGSASQIVDLLQRECALGDVQWRMPCQVIDVDAASEGFVVRTDQGSVHAKAVVIATGGLTVPKIGASPLGYRVAAQFGIAVVAPQPALVPLAFDAEVKAFCAALAGIALDSEVGCNGGRFRDQILFTHRGLSGPAILQISSYWRAGATLEIDLAPGHDLEAWLLGERHGRQRLDNMLAALWPKRLAQAWCAANQCATPLNELGEKRLREIAHAIRCWRLVPAGTLGYNKAEVTRGGVDTRALSSKTMAALRVPGLHFIGEVVDVTGWLGGYNFHWAWASGHAAGESI
ncbi:MAG: NAD(P)/FAD-dependent oxidoreductase [Burkholderiales bacterium]|nr:NAD(P)/FAD-dependent oxidoreductase [Burkholderiales bacterium]